MLYLIEYHQHHLRYGHPQQHKYQLLLLRFQNYHLYLYYKHQDYLMCVIMHQQHCCRYKLYLNQYHQHHLHHKHLRQHRCLLLLLRFQNYQPHLYHKHQDCLMCVIMHQQHCRRYTLYLSQDHQHHLQHKHLRQHRYLILLLTLQKDHLHLCHKHQDCLKCGVKHQWHCCKYKLYLSQYHQHHLHNEHLRQHRCLLLLLTIQKNQQNWYHKHQDYLRYGVKHQ